MTQRDASEEALAELAAAGALDGAVLRLLAEQVRGLAQQVDLKPDNAALWGQYRSAWLELREVASSDDTDRQALAILARLGEAALGDSATD